MAEVYAVKTIAEIKLVDSLLRKHKSELLADIWRFGVNSGLRISELLSITVDEANEACNTKRLTIVEDKTGKTKRLRINQTAYDVLLDRVSTAGNNRYLFQSGSNRAKILNKPIGRGVVSRAFAEVGDIIGVKMGTHSMRKTFGWTMHSQGASIERVCSVLGHSSPSMTMRYIGLTQADIDSAYDEFEIKI